MWPVQTGRGLQVGKKPPESVARYHLQGRGPNVGSVTAAPQQTEKATGSWDDIRWWQHDNKGSNWWNEWRRTYVSVTRIIRELKKNDEVQGAD